MKRAHWLLATVPVVMLFFACATNPVTGRRELSLMSEEQEIQMGREADEQVRLEMGVYDDPGVQQYVERVGMTLARVSERPNLPWHFGVVDATAVNAFALPGGYVYVTRGILPFLQSEAQLAGVLGHEIGHVTARHAAKQYTRAVLGGGSLAILGAVVPETQAFGGLAQAGLGVWFLKYGRDDELQADQLGVHYGSMAGWHPRGVSQLLGMLGRLDQATPDRKGVPNWLSTHPQPTDRVQHVEALVAQAEAAGPPAPAAGRRAEWRIDRDGYLRAIDGIVFGDDPRQGVVRGSDFLHPDMRFAISFPSGWQVNNGTTQVTAKAPNANLVMLLQLVQKPTGSNVSEIAASTIGKAGFLEVNGTATTINGISAYAGTYNGTLKDVGEVVMRAAHFVDGGRVYLVAGISPAAEYPKGDAAFNRAINSFRRMSASEAAGFRPNRVQLYTCRPGDTWTALAERSRGAVKPGTLAIMNDHDPDDPPRPGERIRIVIAG